MLTIELEADVALGRPENPHFNWDCPLCGAEYVRNSPSEGKALDDAVTHLLQRHSVDWDQIRVSFEYWLLGTVRGLDFKKVEKK